MKCETVKREDSSRQRVGPLRWAILLTFHVFTFHSLTPSAFAQPTQEEVFKSIGQNVGEPVDSRHVIAVIAGIAGVIILVAVVGQRRTGRRPSPGALHHHGKLLKEVARAASLKNGELKQLKALVHGARTRGAADAPDSPLTLLLCPSLLARAADADRGKVDREAVARLVKRLAARG